MKLLFNSLGSNYSPAFTLKSLLPGLPGARTHLAEALKQRYDANEVRLSYKGREAITLALKALDLPRGSKVAVNGYTCYAVYQGVQGAGLEPYYVDIEPGSTNYSAAGLNKALSKEPSIKAVIIQNTLGRPCDIEGIEKFCKSHKLPLIEDLAHSIGLIYKDGREAGTVGVMSALSFAQYKVIDAVSGGAVVSKQALNIKDKQLSAPLRRRLVDPLFAPITAVIRNTMRIGLGKPIQTIVSRLKLLPKPIEGEATPWRNMTNWHASRSLRGLSKLDSDLVRRQNIARIYREELPVSIQLEHITNTVFVRFPILVDDPKALIEHLKARGIFISDTWYDSPVSPVRFLYKTNYKKGSCPNAEELSQRMINLPTHVHVDEPAARYIVKEVKAWLQLNIEK